MQVARQTYSHYETGRIQPPVGALFLLSKLYDVPVESLLELLKDILETELANKDGLSDSEHELIHYYRMPDDRDRGDISLFTKIKARQRGNGYA